MTDIKSMLTRKTSLRKACKDLALDELEKAFGNLEEILVERREEAQALAEQEAQKQEKIAELRKEMKQYDIDIDELITVMQTGGAKPGKKAVVKPKYRLVDDNGKEHLWSGRGRTPKVFKEEMEKGRKKEDFLIEG